MSEDSAQWDGYVAQGREALRQRDDAQWRLGDLALEVQATYGERDCQRYAEVIGVEYDTLRDYRRVARAYNAQNGGRPPFCSWWIHRLLAGQDDRIALVQQAAERKWTTRDVEAFLEERRTAAQPSATLSPAERLLQSDAYRNALAEQDADNGRRGELDGPKARIGAKGAREIPSLDIKLERLRSEVDWLLENCEIEALASMDTRQLERTAEVLIGGGTELLARIQRTRQAAV